MSDSDVDVVLALNEESVWALSQLDSSQLARHRKEAAHAIVCQVDAQVAAFAIAYAPAAAYDSVNYAWFGERFADFLYLDRIAVSTRFRRRGIATAMYDELESRATSRHRMVCEINSEPPNVQSLAFHTSRGYHEIGHLTRADGHQTVMMEKTL